MQIHLKCPRRASGCCGGFSKRLLPEGKMLNRFALTDGQSCDRRIESSNRMVPSVCCIFGIAAGIGMILVSERRMRFPYSIAALPTHSVDGAPPRDSSKPGTE